MERETNGGVRVRYGLSSGNSSSSSTWHDSGAGKGANGRYGMVDHPNDSGATSPAGLDRSSPNIEASSGACKSSRQNH